MLTVRTDKKREAWRCKIAMFAGVSKRLPVNGCEIEGVVHSIKQENGDPPSWIVSIRTAAVPAIGRENHQARRSAIPRDWLRLGEN
jgi:hypothetical protein